ncbi:plasma membrane H+-transporting ATPase, putative [Rhizoctonia solani AG-3 Rhs1AP]|nr:plasma membrane H+-transporting ATPase, putative [Rhizoctonia solani AG-3 Rhs1AP]KEP45967.1 putative plasma membrane H+-transporting ATPase [Rhizoctonia solani 123E]
MRNCVIYTCVVTIRTAVCFAILAFASLFDFPPFMVLIIALLNILSVGHALPSNTPDAWDFAEIFAFAVAYGLCLTLLTICPRPHCRSAFSRTSLMSLLLPRAR